MTPIRVLVVDDSALARKALTEVLESDPQICRRGAAANPYRAAALIREEALDVIPLDVEMPEMDGLTFLKELMSQRPIPVIICSSLTEERAETTLRALEYGAVDIIAKPRLGAQQFLDESRELICGAVKAAARSRVHGASRQREVEPKLTADAILPAAAGRAMAKTREKVALIGASTGGAEALRRILQQLPGDAPGLVVARHMPEKFTAAFAKRLDDSCASSVKEAENSDTVLSGRVLIAPGNCHFLLHRSGARYFVEVQDGPRVCRHRPSVDVLFRSGARGLLEMKQAVAVTIAQDETSSVVFGMPNEAIKRGAAQSVVSLDRIAAAILAACREDACAPAGGEGSPV